MEMPRPRLAFNFQWCLIPRESTISPNEFKIQIGPIKPWSKSRVFFWQKYQDISPQGNKVTPTPIRRRGKVGQAIINKTSPILFMPTTDRPSLKMLFFRCVLFSLRVQRFIKIGLAKPYLVFLCDHLVLLLIDS